MLGSASAAPAADSRPRRPGSTRAIEDLYFPNWGSRLHWHAIGQRTDHINGRVAVTVYYGVARQEGRVHDRRRPGALGPDRRRDDAKRCRVPHADAERPPRRDVAACGAHLRAVGHRASRQRVLQKLAAWEPGLSTASVGAEAHAAAAYDFGSAATSVLATRWRARCSRVVIVASRTFSACEASR